MKCKKIAALALTGVMTLALAVPAFAAAPATKISGAFEEITISVTLPGTAKAVINPYSMPVKAIADDGSTALTELTTSGKIATNPMIMYNGTEINLNVGATVTATVPTTSGLELVSTAVRDTTTDKQAQVYLEVMRDNTLLNADLSSTDASAVSGVDGAKAVAAFNNWPATTYDRTARNQVLVSADEPQTKENLAIMAAGVENSGAVEPQKGSFILYRLAGSVAKNPDEAWAATDTFEVNVAFTFSPVEPLTGGTISLTTSAIATNELAVAAPAGVDMTGATYKWEIVNPGSTGATCFSAATGKTATDAKPQIKGASSSANPSAGDITLKCTITLADGTMYVSTNTVTLTTT